MLGWVVKEVIWNVIVSSSFDEAKKEVKFG